MTSAYDLSSEFDSRFLKYRENYTTGEHLTSLYEATRANAAINVAGFDMVAHGLDHLGSQLDDVRWAIEDGFYALADEIDVLRQSVEEGFRGMQEVFTWGIARICWEEEQSRKVYQDILAATLRKHQTDSLAYRQDGEKAIKNKWWEESVQDLTRALDLYKYDYLAHLQLSQVLFFQYGQWDPAMEHFQLAARYADASDADADQRYYAALAYTHVALLWRLDAQTYSERAEPSLRKAQEASARAVTLVGDLFAAVQERVLDLFASGDVAGVRRAMEEAALRDEGLLVGLERAPDLVQYDEVGGFARSWRERHADAVQECRDLARSASRLLCSRCEDVLGKETEGNDWPVLDDLLALGSQPRHALTATLSGVEALLDVADNLLDADVARENAAFDDLRTRWRDCEQQVATSSAKLRAAREASLPSDAATSPTVCIGGGAALAGFSGLACLGGGTAWAVVPLAIGLGVAASGVMWYWAALEGVRAEKTAPAGAELDAAREQCTRAALAVDEQQRLAHAVAENHRAFHESAHEVRQRVARLKETLQRIVGAG